MATKTKTIIITCGYTKMYEDIKKLLKMYIKQNSIMIYLD